MKAKMNIQQALMLYSQRAWREYCISKALVCVPITFILGVFSYAITDLLLPYGLGIEVEYGWFVALGLVLLSLVSFIGVYYFSPIAKMLKSQYNSENSADIFNRQYPQLQFSCQLALKERSTLNTVERLQLSKIEQVFTTLAEQNPRFLKPCHRLNEQNCHNIRVLWLLFLVSMGITLGLLHHFTAKEKVPKTGLLEPYSYVTNVKVEPPAYTQLTSKIEYDGNLIVPEGSTVSWQLYTTNAFDRVLAPKLKLNDSLLPLEKRYSDKWSVSQVVNHAGLYQIVGQQPEGNFTSLHSITVVKDQAPKVRMIAPNATLVTFAKDELPHLVSKTLVSDDFVISDVKLVVSMAKGSGEAVKFRDLSVDFDDEFPIKSIKGDLYQKTWDFKALGMEVGDELYFSVHAWDNKTPDAQVTRSSTVIVRWLDEQRQDISAEGLLVNNMPEYFRSQRQIIIETEQLIADMPELSQNQIDDLSVSLGQSQQDLKLRYGQYLGDEVGQGPGDQAQFIGGSVEHGDESYEDDGHRHHHDHGPREQEHSQQQIGEKLQQAAAEHQDHEHHDHDEDTKQDSNLGSAQAVQDMFAHTHEEVHVGEVSSQNPKAMMKKAVSFMWQAELHLMLSEPQKALPFELQAYKYLKLAKQSERIYVQRLGFEPPPVSEDKRLSGELDEIESYQLEAKLALQESDIHVFRQAFALLRTPLLAEFSHSEQQLLKQLKNRLVELSENRPVLIEHVLTVEKVLMANKPLVDDCDNCVDGLAGKLWQLIDMSQSEPFKRDAQYLDGDNLAVDFATMHGSYNASTAHSETREQGSKR